MAIYMLLKDGVPINRIEYDGKARLDLPPGETVVLEKNYTGPAYVPLVAPPDQTADLKARVEALEAKTATK